MNSEEKITFLKRAMLFPPAFLKERLRQKFMESEESLSRVLRALFTEGIEAGIIRRERIEDLLASYYCLLDGSFIQMFYYGRQQFEERLQSVWRMY